MKVKIVLPVIALSLITSNMAFAENDRLKSESNNSSRNSVHKTENEQGQMGAVEIILKDHQHIRQMIAAIDKNLDSNIEASRSGFKELKDFLVKHETMEQKAWYPELKKNKDLDRIIGDLIKEEDAAGKAIKKIEATSNQSDWVTEVRTFFKAVEQHAKDEETKLFPKVREVMDKTSLEKLGKKLSDYKKTQK